MAARQLHLLRCNLPDNQRRRRRRILRHQLDPLESYTDSELRSRYRFGREALQYTVSHRKKKSCENSLLSFQGCRICSIKRNALNA